jgi:hypothetical protein
MCTASRRSAEQLRSATGTQRVSLTCCTAHAMPGSTFAFRVPAGLQQCIPLGLTSLRSCACTLSSLLKASEVICHPHNCLVLLSEHRQCLLFLNLNLVSCEYRWQHLCAAELRQGTFIRRRDPVSDFAHPKAFTQQDKVGKDAAQHQEVRAAPNCLQLCHK